MFEDPDSDSECTHPLVSSSDSDDDKECDNGGGGDESSSDKEQNGAIWLDEADEDMIRMSDPSAPCCAFACSSRGRQCLMDIMRSIKDSLAQRDEQLEPPPGDWTQEETQPPPDSAESNRDEVRESLVTERDKAAHAHEAAAPFQ